PFCPFVRPWLLLLPLALATSVTNPDGGSGGGGGALPNGRTGEIRRGDDFRCPFLLSPVDRTLERYFADVEGDWRRAFVLELRSGATGGGGGTWLGLCSVLADGKRDSFSSL